MFDMPDVTANLDHARPGWVAQHEPLCTKISRMLEISKLVINDFPGLAFSHHPGWVNRQFL